LKRRQHVAQALKLAANVTAFAPERLGIHRCAFQSIDDEIQVPDDLF
jgi:hypothetical protein